MMSHNVVITTLYFIFSKINSKLIFYKDEQVNETIIENDKNEEQRKIRKNRNTDRGLFDTQGQNKDLFIYEIVMLRRTSVVKRVEKSIQMQSMQNYKNIKSSKLKSILDKDDILFDLKIVRVFRNINHYFGDFFPSITAIGTLANIYFDERKDTVRLLYENHDITKFAEGKLAYDEKTYENYKTSEFTWKWFSVGFVGYKSDRAVFVKIDVDISKQDEIVNNPAININESIETMVINITPSKIIKLGFIIENPNLEIANVYEWLDIRQAVIQISNKVTFEHIFVVWDLENNSEICNYSMKGDFRYIQGVSSDSGYLLTENSYVNLDNGTPSPYFDHNFVAFYEDLLDLNNGGFKISSKGTFSLLLCLIFVFIKG